MRVKLGILLFSMRFCFIGKMNLKSKQGVRPCGVRVTMCCIVPSLDVVVVQQLCFFCDYRVVELRVIAHRRQQL